MNDDGNTPTYVLGDAGDFADAQEQPSHASLLERQFPIWE